MAGTGKKKIPGKSWNAWIFLWVIYACNANIREILNRVAPYTLHRRRIWCKRYSAGTSFDSGTWIPCSGSYTTWSMG